MGKQNVLTIPGRYAEIKRLCQFVTDGAVKAGLSPKEVFHIELACDEACTNIIEHAYGGEDIGSIRVQWESQPGYFIITLQDNGRTFRPENITTPTKPNPDALDKLKIGGLGMHFMRQLMDKVTYKFDEKSNTLVMIKMVNH